MLLPPTSSEADSTHPSQADNQSDQLFRPKSVGLLQLCVGWATEVSHRSIAARSECCARLICGLSPHDHVTPALYDLHWLPVEQRVTFKLCTLMQLIHTGCSPSYMSELVTSTYSIASRSRLRSASSRRYEQPATRLTLGEQSIVSTPSDRQIFERAQLASVENESRRNLCFRLSLSSGQCGRSSVIQDVQAPVPPCETLSAILCFYRHLLPTFPDTKWRLFVDIADVLDVLNGPRRSPAWPIIQVDLPIISDHSFNMAHYYDQVSLLAFVRPRCVRRWFGAFGLVVYRNQGQTICFLVWRQVPFCKGDISKMSTKKSEIALK